MRADDTAQTTVLFYGLGPEMDRHGSVWAENGITTLFRKVPAIQDFMLKQKNKTNSNPHFFLGIYMFS